MALNGQKWSKMVQNGESGQNVLKGSKMAKIVKNCQNGPKWSGMVQNGPKLFKMGQVVKNGKR